VLSPDDAEVVARDPEVLAMADLLDPDRAERRIAAVAARDWGAVTSARVTYLRYKPGVSLTAAVEAVTPSGVRHGYAVAGTATAADKLAKPVLRGRQAPGDFAPHLAHDVLLLGPLTADPALRAARRVVAEPADLVPGAVRATVLRYKPARRLVARLDGTAGPVGVARVQPTGTAPPTAAAARCWAELGVEVAAVHRPRRGGRVTLVDFLQGANPVDGTEPGLLAEAGALLARAHRAHPFRGAACADHRASARTAVRSVTAIAPHLGAAATAVSARVGALLGARAPGVLVHGDLSVDQVLVRGPGLALLDLDRVRLDLPAADAASWFAAEVLAGRWSPDADPVDALQPMIRAYAAGSAGQLTDRLRPLAALALLQRAGEPFRLRQGGGEWAERVAALVDGAAVQAGRR
jgi:hypothetical protein